MDKKVTVSIVLISLIALVGGVLLITGNASGTRYSNLEEFAKCVTDRGAVMYGAAWCPHCQSQKQKFGESFENIKYVECPEQAQLCIEKKIEGYPTWEFSDGSRVEGEMSLEKIAEKTSCQLSGI